MRLAPLAQSLNVTFPAASGGLFQAGPPPE